MIGLVATIPTSRIDRVWVYQNPISRVDRKDLLEVQKETGADYVMNFSFYDMTKYVPMFGLKSEGTWLSTSDMEGIGFDKTGVGFGKPTDCIHSTFISGYPILIRGGKPTSLSIPSDLTGDRGRSAIGITRNKDLLLRSLPDLSGTDDFTLAELQMDLFNRECVCAVNVDGGGSSQAYFNGEYFNSPSGRQVQNYLCIKLLKPMYRVQLDAFRSKASADATAILYGGILRSGLSDPTKRPFVTTVYM